MGIQGLFSLSYFIPFTFLHWKDTDRISIKWLAFTKVIKKGLFDSGLLIRGSLREIWSHANLIIWLMLIPTQQQSFQEMKPSPISWCYDSPVRGVEMLTCIIWERITRLLSCHPGLSISQSQLKCQFTFLTVGISEIACHFLSAVRNMLLRSITKIYPTYSYFTKFPHISIIGYRLMSNIGAHNKT